MTTQTLFAEAMLLSYVNPNSLAGFAIFSRNNCSAPQSMASVRTRDLRPDELCTGSVQKISRRQPHRLRRKSRKFELSIECLGLLRRVITRTTVFVHLLEADNNAGVLEKPELQTPDFQYANISATQEAAVGTCDHVGVSTGCLRPHVMFDQNGRIVSAIGAVGLTRDCVDIVQQIVAERVHYLGHRTVWHEAAAPFALSYHTCDKTQEKYSENYSSPQRALAAFFAICLRFLGLSFLARALPPMRPSATAAAFLPSSVVTSSISPVAILAIMTARALTSAGRRSPFGPLAIVI